MNNQHNHWVNFTLLSTLLMTPYPLLSQSESDGQMCADVITYGQNPQTGEWQTFPTPCDVPKGWQSSSEKPESSVRADTPTTTDTQVCGQVITYGQNPQTGVWVEYPTPCDVPAGWKTSPTKPDTGSSSIQPDTATTDPKVCEQVITYGQNPQTGVWVEYPTPCDVPAGWKTSPTKPDTGSSAIQPDNTTPDSKVCEQVITYGQNPQTGVWVEYPTPCDVPAGWKTSPTKPDTGGSVIQPDNTTPTTGTGSSTNNTTSGNQNDCTKEETTYAQHPTSGKWYIFSKPCEVPTGWKNSKTGDVCAAIIIYGQSPNTGTWYPFATPCDVPTPWLLALIKPEKNGTPKEGLICPDSTEYAQNPKTTNAYQFNSACDIPDGWTRLDEKPFKLMPEGDVNCPPVITYAQSAEKKTWYAFPTICEVPQGWIKSATPPPVTEGEDCSSFRVTYSSTEGKVHIPFIFLNSTDTQPTFKEAELELLSTPLFSPYLFFLTKVSDAVEDSQP